MLKRKFPLFSQTRGIPTIKKQSIIKQFEFIASYLEVNIRLVVSQQLLVSVEDFDYL